MSLSQSLSLSDLDRLKEVSVNGSMFEPAHGRRVAGDTTLLRADVLEAAEPEHTYATSPGATAWRGTSRGRSPPSVAVEDCRRPSVANRKHEFAIATMSDNEGSAWW